MNMLNESLDVQQLKNEFRQKKRIRIQNLLKADCADACHECLVSRTPWILRFRHQGQSAELTQQQFEQLTYQQKMQFSQDMAHFDFIHRRFAMHEAFQQSMHRDLYLYKVYQYL